METYEEAIKRFKLCSKCKHVREGYNSYQKTYLYSCKIKGRLIFELDKICDKYEEKNIE